MVDFRHTDFYEKRKKGKFRLVDTPDTSFAVADTHCHLEMSEDPAWLFVRAAAHNVDFLACVVDSTDDGIDGLNKVEAAYEEAKNLLLPGTNLPELRYIIGTHPHHADRWNSDEAKKLKEMLKHDRVSCVGEIGLDFHYDMSARDAQLRVFEEQLQIAEEVGLPVALHIRDAHSDALKLLKKVGWNKQGTLLHCFTLGPLDLKPWIDAGCYVSFGGALTFKKSDEIREAAKLVPADKLLTETDAPFMTPEPMRGMECYPDHVIFTAEKLCEVLGQTENKENFYSQIYQNALDFLDK